jgi:drug/metabolite transporter (DMT)-like permease
VSEWIGVSIALVSSCLGGTAAAITRYLVGSADPITLAILRWGIGFLCLLPTALFLKVKWRSAAIGPRSPPWGFASSDCFSSSIISQSALRPRLAPVSHWRHYRSTPWWSGRCLASSR